MKKVLVVIMLAALAVMPKAVFADEETPKMGVGKIAALEVKIEKLCEALNARLLGAEETAYQNALAAIEAGDGKKALECFKAYELYLKVNEIVDSNPEFALKKKEAYVIAAMQYAVAAEHEIADGKLYDAETTLATVARYKRLAEE